MHIYIYIYIYRERDIDLLIYIYIYIYTHQASSRSCSRPADLVPCELLLLRAYLSEGDTYNTYMI